MGKDTNNDMTWGDPAASLMLVMEPPADAEYGIPGRMVAKLLGDACYQVVTVGSDENYEELAKLIGERRPVVVVPMGSLVLKLCTGQTNIWDWRGYIMQWEDFRTVKVTRTEQTIYKTSGKGHNKGDPRAIKVKAELPPAVGAGVRHVIPTLSVTDVQKSGLALLPVMGADLARAVRFAENPQLEISAGPWFSYGVTNCSGWTGGTVAVDVETSPDGVVNQIALADANHTISITWRDWARRQVGQLGTMIAHNAAFDYAALRGMGCDLHGVKLWDTMLAAYMLNPDGKKSLNWVISQYLDTRRHKHLAGEDFARYNALDARQTYDLYPKLRAGLERTGQLDFFENGMMVALPTLVGMNRRGIAIDQAFVAQWEQELVGEINDIESGTSQGDLLHSPMKLAHHLGLKNSDEEALTRLKLRGHAQMDLIDTVLAYRAAAKNLRTYCRPAKGVERVYPNYLPGDRDTDENNKGIAYSGRPTARHPNIQNQPKEARRMYVPDHGRVLVSLDWSQIEPRIAAALSQDDILAADIHSGLYDAVANTLDCDRQTAKTVVLLSAYLGSPKILQKQLMLRGLTKSYAECKSLQDRMFARYRNWQAWRQRVIDEAQRCRALRNVFGKWAPFYRPHPAKAVNFHPQSCAACILWYCLPQVEKAIPGWGGSLVCTVHDEITFQVPPSYVGPAVTYARNVMEQHWDQLGISVPTKAKIGEDWRDMKELQLERTTA